ncbi:2-hydroxyacid dehydrogenase [Rhodoligotrophos defluvii]|uniref:2-hydroxyacid dehydrogenase n=1 Tax=Rhodoligotrophos defluvii TaxID=2561934 RepID=UPI0010C9E359|nr:glyoxylate/hydroxypyruvate reductase A [Rhodoligotrophos defluvii]
MRRATFLFRGKPEVAERWRNLFQTHAPEVDFRAWPDTGDVKDIRYIGLWDWEPSFERHFPNLEVVFSLGAGIDQFWKADLPEHLPIVRVIDDDLTQQMVEYVTFAVMAHHRELITYQTSREAQAWQPRPVRTAGERPVGVMGLGVLGSAAVERLKQLGFQCRGWSRTSRDIPEVACYSGAVGLPPFLNGCEILVCLLPLTPETEGIINARLLRQLPPGAALVNVGRGGHLVERDLLDALDSGHLSGAILDVFESEPLPPGHPLWTHPKVLMTPHVASTTRPEGVVRGVLENLRRLERGEHPLGLVDRKRGY